MNYEKQIGISIKINMSSNKQKKVLYIEKISFATLDKNQPEQHAIRHYSNDGESELFIPKCLLERFNYDIEALLRNRPFISLVSKLVFNSNIDFKRTGLLDPFSLFMTQILLTEKACVYAKQ